MVPTDDARMTDQFPLTAKSHTSRPKLERRRRFVHRISLGVLGLALMAVSIGAVLAHQVSSVRIQLEHTLDLVPELRAELEDGDQQAAQLTFTTMREETSAARSTTTGALWKSASFIPVYGANFSAVRERSEERRVGKECPV